VSIAVTWIGQAGRRTPEHSRHSPGGARRLPQWLPVVVSQTMTGPPDNIGSIATF